MYRANLNHLVKVAEHGNAASWPGLVDRADLTARRVIRRCIGKTEEAKARGNTLDRPTSVRSEMARKYWEPLFIEKANDDRRPSVDASQGCSSKEHSVLAARYKYSQAGFNPAGQPKLLWAGFMKARAV